MFLDLHRFHQPFDIPGIFCCPLPLLSTIFYDIQMTEHLISDYYKMVLLLALPKG